MTSLMTSLTAGPPCQHINRYTTYFFDLLKCIASALPVCSYFPAIEEFQAAFDNLCNSLRIGNQTDDLLVIKNSAPIFFIAIQFWKSTNVLYALKNLIQLLKKKCMAAFPGDNIILNKNQ